MTTTETQIPDTDEWPADLVMDTTRVDETDSSVVTRAATLADLVDADEQDEDDDFDPRYCVGNSRVWIEHYYSETSARCACGSTVVLLANGRWVHRSPGYMGALCPPYECECGQRHNVPTS
jgi:hypothetical protein